MHFKAAPETALRQIVVEAVYSQERRHRNLDVRFDLPAALPTLQVGRGGEGSSDAGPSIKRFKAADT